MKKKSTSLNNALAILCALCWISQSQSAAFAERLYTVTDGNVVNVVDSNAPAVVLQSDNITGLAAGETVVGIDYRANGGGIYVVGSGSNFYTMDPNTFAVTPVGPSAPLSPMLVGNAFAYDYNPSAAGGILSRIISDTDNNRVLDSTTGGYFGSVDKTAVEYRSGDANVNANPNIQGIAYDTNVSGASGTQQFGIDATLAVLTTVANNAGTLETIGSLGPAATGLTDEVAFDISGETNDAFASLQVGGLSQLYGINLDTGAASLVGTIGLGDTVRGLTVVPLSAIPEPSALTLLAMASFGLGIRRRKRS